MVCCFNKEVPEATYIKSSYTTCTALKKSFHIKSPHQPSTKHDKQDLQHRNMLKNVGDCRGNNIGT